MERRNKENLSSKTKITRLGVSIKERLGVRHEKDIFMKKQHKIVNEDEFKNRLTRFFKILENSTLHEVQFPGRGECKKSD